MQASRSLGAGTLGAAQAVVKVGCAGFGGAAVEVRGTYSGTITFEGTVDGTVFSPVAMTTADGATTATTTTSTGLFQGSVAGLSALQARMSSYTSGEAQIDAQASGDTY